MRKLRESRELRLLGGSVIFTTGFVFMICSTHAPPAGGDGLRGCRRDAPQPAAVAAAQQVRLPLGVGMGDESRSRELGAASAPATCTKMIRWRAIKHTFT